MVAGRANGARERVPGSQVSLSTEGRRVVDDAAELLGTLGHTVADAEIDLPGLYSFALFGPALGATAIMPDMNPTKPAEVDPARLVEAIRDEILAAPERRITFARFMQRALTEPGLGYYATSELRPTRAGYFLTAPELHPFFGRCLGRIVSAAWEASASSPFRVLEYGGGRGTLRDEATAGLGFHVHWTRADLPHRSDDDGRPDEDEAGDGDLSTPPVDTDGDGTPDFQDPDSDDDGVADGAELSALVGSRHVAVAPVGSAVDGTAAVVGEDDEAGEVLVLAAEAVRHPRTERRTTAEDPSRIHLQHRRAVNGTVGGH